MSSTALWLDPFRSLKPAEQVLLGQAGVSTSMVCTYEELEASVAQLGDQRGLLVLGLGSDIDLLIEALQLLQSAKDRVSVICRVERRHLELAVAAMRHGACHVLAADDWSAQAWRKALDCAKTQAPGAAQQSVGAGSVQSAALSMHKPGSVGASLAPQSGVRSVVFVDPVSIKLLALAQRVAQAQVAVLIEGPTGSGKEVLARVLHESSPCADGPFVGLNCAALPEHMIEDMLFGHEKGAFTGAVKDHRGLFEQAQGGTIFLDEVGELPMALQAKLLRVLQERSLVKLGGERAIALNLRVVAATNKNLRLAIEQREFREDLYFRLSTFKLRVPPVSERTGDILPIVARLLARYQRDDQAWSVSPAAQLRLLSYPWPGNVREIENVVQRAMVLCGDCHIDTEHLMFDDGADGAEFLSSLSHQPVLFGPPACQLPSSPSSPSSPSLLTPMFGGEDGFAVGNKLQTAVKNSEQSVIRSALETSKNKIEAAQKLGISPRTLRYKMAQLRDINPEQLANA